jgi:hypothetical protein
MGLLGAFVAYQVSYKSKTYPSVKNLCEKQGFVYANVKSRLQRGWSLHDACQNTRNPGKKHKGPHVKNRLAEIASGQWRCSDCKVVKPLNEFFSAPSCIGGHSRQCRQCNRSKYQLAKYGVSKTQYSQMLMDQNYKCACCGTLIRERVGGQGKKTVCVDYDHQTGEVRGLLCGLCNTGIGALGDNIQGVKNALQYLEKHYGKA